jgi:hypothetical protein
VASEDVFPAALKFRPTAADIAILTTVLLLANRTKTPLVVDAQLLDACANDVPIDLGGKRLVFALFNR